MQKSSKHKLGSVQLEIMKVLWSKGQATAREISEALAVKENLAHSTVQTLLRKLEAKGAIRHDEGDRIFVFKALWQQDETAATATHDLLSRVFGGSVTGLVSHLLKNETIDPEELKRLRLLVDRAARELGEDQ